MIDTDRIDQTFARFADQRRPEDLAEVFDATAPRLLIVALRLASEQLEAEDLVQSTFLRAMEKADLYDPKRPLMPWLVAILANEFRSRLRRRDLRERKQPEPGSGSRAPDEIAALTETAELIEARIESIPEAYRSAIRLRLLHGLNGPEIARVLEIPEQTVRTRLHRGLELLKKGLPPSVALTLVLLIQGRGLAQLRIEVLAKVEPKPLPAGLAVNAKLMIATMVTLAAVVAVVTIIDFSPQDEGRELAHGEFAGTSASARPLRTSRAAEPLLETTESSAAAPRRMAGPSILGRVVDPEGRGRETELRVEVFAGPELVLREYLSSDGQGDYELPLILPRGLGPIARWGLQAQVTAIAPGMIPSAPAIVNLLGVPRQKVSDLTLAPGRIVRGRIEDRLGKPVGEAEIRVLDGAGLCINAVRGEADGTFRLDLAQDAARRLQFHRLDRGSAALECPGVAIGDEVDLGRVVLHERATILGRVTLPDGAPVSRALIELSPLNSGAPSLEAADFKRWRSSAAGEIEMRDLEAGRYRMRIFADSGGFTETAVATDLPATDIVVDLRSLRVRLVDRDDRVVGGPTVLITEIDSAARALGDAIELYSWRTGIHEGLVPMGKRWRLDIVHPYLAATSTVIEPGSRRVDCRIEVAQRLDQGQFGLELRGEEGQPRLAELRIEHEDQMSDGLALMVEGSTSLSLPAGRYLATLSSADPFDCEVSFAFEIEPGMTTDEEVTFSRGGRIELAIEGPTGSSEGRWPRLRLRLVTPEFESRLLQFTWPRRSVFDAQPERPPRGQAIEILPLIPPGRHRIMVELGNAPPQELEILVIAGRRVRSIVRLD